MGPSPGDYSAKSILRFLVKAAATLAILYVLAYAFGGGLSWLDRLNA